MEHEPGKNDGNVSALNQALIEELKKTRYIETSHVEEAFQAVLRHQFLPRKPLEEVYANRVVLAKQDQNGQWISSSSSSLGAELARSVPTVQREPPTAGYNSFDTSCRLFGSHL